MTCRATRRERVLVSRAVHRHYRETIATYFLGGGLTVDEIPLVADGPGAGTTDLAALERLLGDADRPVAGVIAGQPNFLGLLEPMADIGRLAHAAGALFVAVVEPVSLAVLAPPGEYGADIASGEGQPLGIAPQYGGPYLGILASTDALVRQIPGRLVGMTSDLDGKRAFVMTMRAREQDIRREKAASNICTNQALLALAASVYLALLGPHGLRDVAALGAARAAELEAALAEVGIGRLHHGPYLNEFAIRVPGRADGPSPAARSRRPGRARPGRGRARRPHARRRPAGVRDGGHHAPTRSNASPPRCRTCSSAARRSRSRPARAPPQAARPPSSRSWADERDRTAAAADDLREVEPRSRRRQGPAPAARRARPDPGRGPPGDAGRAARAQRARGRPPLRQPEPAQLRRRHGLLSARLVHDEVEPEAQRVGGPAARLRRPPPARPRRDRAGHPRAAVGARGGARRDQRDDRGDAPAGGRRTGRADRHPDDPGLPSLARRPRAERGPRSRQLARDEPRDGLDGRLQDGDRSRPRPTAGSTSTRSRRRSARGRRP